MSTAKKITAAKKSDAAKKSSAAKKIPVLKKNVPIVTHYNNDGRDSNEDYIRDDLIADGYAVFDKDHVLGGEYKSLEVFDAALKNGELDEGTYYLYRITPVKIIIVKD